MSMGITLSIIACVSAGFFIGTCMTFNVDITRITVALETIASHAR